MSRAIFLSAAKVLFLAACLILALSCGRSGKPVPPAREGSFTFSAVRIQAVGNCLAVQGKIEGNPRFVDRIDLELSPVRGPEDCPGCPFNPTETGEFPLRELSLDPEDGGFSFAYCPARQAQVYRWRLVGRNIETGLPHALTNPSIIAVPAGNM